jgi:hypothetical protein
MADMTGVAKEAFQILLRFDYVVKLYDQDGMVVAEPSEARRMFASSPNILLSLLDADDDSSIKLLFGKSTHANDINGLLQAMRTTATKYNLTFQPKQYGKEIDPKDYQSLMSVSESVKETDMHICEGMYGTSRSSYLQLDHAKMIVHHNQPINPTQVNGRARQIGTIFIENAAGERVQVPSQLALGRALTEHINIGGAITDDIGQALIWEATKPVPKPTRPPVTRSTLAENNPVVRDFINWTEQFAPDRALLEFNDPDDPAEQTHEEAEELVIKDFNPNEFMASSEYKDMLSGRGPAGDHDPSGEDSHIGKDEVMDALNSYIRNYIQTYHGAFNDGFNGDTESLASAVYDQTAGAMHQAGLTIDDADELTPHPDALMDGPEGNELTREDILLPNRDQGAGLARAVTKPVVHDDPTNPDEEHLTGHSDDVSRLKLLAGIRSPI